MGLTCVLLLAFVYRLVLEAKHIRIAYVQPSEMLLRRPSRNFAGDYSAPDGLRWMGTGP